MTQKVRDVDAVIVGGGIVGMFTALTLHDRGMQNIVVVDKSTIGGIASARSAGMLRRHYHIPLLVEMATCGEEAYASFRDRFGRDIGFTKCGYLLAVYADQGEQLMHQVEMQRSMGVDIEIMAAKAVAQEFPEFKNLGSDFAYAYERSCSYADPVATTRAMASLLREVGIKAHDDEEVLSIAVANGCVKGVETTHYRWNAEIVVNCAGAWGGAVAALAGVDIPVKVHRLLQIIEVDYPAGTSGTRILSHEPADLYARPISRRRMLIGGRIPFEEPAEAESTTLVADTGKAADLKRRYQHYVRAPLGQIRHGWAGVDGDTPDYQPVLGPHPEVEGFFSATGFSGHGFKLAPVAGQLIGDYVFRSPLRLPMASALAPERFRTGDLLPRGSKQMGS